MLGEPVRGAWSGPPLAAPACFAGRARQLHNTSFLVPLTSAISPWRAAIVPFGGLPSYPMEASPFSPKVGPAGPTEGQERGCLERGNRVCKQIQWADNAPAGSARKPSSASVGGNGTSETAI